MVRQETEQTGTDFCKKKKKKLDKREKSVMQEKKENLIKDGNRECVQ